MKSSPDKRNATSPTKTTFETVAQEYDNSLRFFQESARLMTAHFDPAAPLQILDVATGTGNAALALAEQLPRATITGVDFSPAMLEQARAKAAQQQIENVAFQEMDMQDLTFPDKQFDAAVCAFGIFFVDDIEQQLRKIAATVKPGGTVLVSCFNQGSFSPCVDLFLKRIEQYGLNRPPLRWQRLDSEEKCRALFQTAGLTNISIKRTDLGAYLELAEQWWDMVWNGGFRGLVEQLPAGTLPQFRQEHLQEIEQLRSTDGIHMHLQVLHTIGLT